MRPGYADQNKTTSLACETISLTTVHAHACPHHRQRSRGERKRQRMRDLCEQDLGWSEVIIGPAVHKMLFLMKDATFPF